jgi:DNA-binding CsgD family transcriptional regulator
MTLLTRVPLRGEARAATDARARGTDPRLTPRQRQVLEGLIRGLANKEIAAELGIGPDAVKRVISRLLIKLDASSRTALVKPALQTDAARRRHSRAPSALSLLDVVPVPAEPGAELRGLLPPAPRGAIVRIADESFAADAPRIARGVAFHDVPRVGTNWRRADVFASPIHDGAGKLAGLVIFFVDVSNDPMPTRSATTSELPARDRERPA